ncbi:MAG: hypothetical protein AMXMBFR46_08690 [Acidimicrobiia bacterium]
MSRPVLRVVSADATDEEVAAIVAAVTALTARPAAAAPGDDTLHEWVRSARLSAHRSGLRRGPWRLSGRIGRRSRA